MNQGWNSETPNEASGKIYLSDGSEHSFTVKTYPSGTIPIIGFSPNTLMEFSLDGITANETVAYVKGTAYIDIALPKNNTGAYLSLSREPLSNPRTAAYNIHTAILTQINSGVYITGYEITANAPEDFYVHTYTVEELSTAITTTVDINVGSNNFINAIGYYSGLIFSLFNTVISIIQILKVIFIDNLFMLIGLAEAGILIISLRQNPSDIFGFLKDVVGYNAQFIEFMIKLLSGFLNVFMIIAQIGYNVAKSIPIIGNFL
jgi:hypothetical protein